MPTEHRDSVLRHYKVVTSLARSDSEQRKHVQGQAVAFADAWVCIGQCDGDVLPWLRWHVFQVVTNDLNFANRRFKDRWPGARVKQHVDRFFPSRLRPRRKFAPKRFFKQLAVCEQRIRGISVCVQSPATIGNINC